MESKDRLIIFVRNADVGKVKTRLGESIGNDAALRIYIKLLEVTWSQAKDVNAAKHVFYSERVEQNDTLMPSENKFVQKGADLGERMLNAFQDSFENGAEKMVIIGSDCPEITTELIDSAFENLDRYDVVLGPAKDGGYYLLGMKCPLPMLFRNKEWGTDTVFADTVLDLIDMGLTHFRLKELSDLDTIYDLHLLDDLP